jgi:hypothetical protein
MFVPVVFCLHMVLICLGTFSGESHATADINCHSRHNILQAHYTQLCRVHTWHAYSSASAPSQVRVTVQQT